MAITIYVYSSGAVAQEMLNAVAAFCGSGDLTVAMTIAGCLSITFGVAQYIRSRDLRTFLWWTFIYLMVTGVLIKPLNQPVQVFDASNPLGTYVVDNVPIGVAIPAHFASAILYGLTGDLETVYSTPNELNYSQTGMVFGAKLFGVTTQSQIYDGQTQVLFNQFVANCIVPDIARGKYSWASMAGSTDLNTFFSNANLSPLFGVYNQGNFLNCQQAWPVLQNMMSGQVSQTMASQAVALFPGNVQYQQNIGDYVSASYNYYFNNLSMTAQQLMGQNVIANAIMNGGLALSSSTDAMAAQVNYAASTAEAKQQISWMSDGKVAIEVLPIMQTVLFLILIGIFPLVAMLALIPTYTTTILSNYVIGFVYVCTWPLFFDIINFIMNVYMERYFSAYGGVSISNLSQLTQMVHNAEAICGYLMISVPFLPFMLLGLSRAMGALSHITSGTQAFTSGSGIEAATGNMSFGNTSMGTHAWNSTSANKFDTNTAEAYGKISMQMSSGAIASRMPDGNESYDASPALSHLPSNLSTSQTFSAATQERYSKDMSTVRSTQMEMSQLASDTLSKSQQLQSMLSSTESVGSGASYGDQSNVGNTLNSLTDHLQSYQEGLLAAHQDNSNMQTSLSGGLNASASGEGKFGGVGAKVGVSGEAGALSLSSDQTEASLSAQVNQGADYRQSINNDIANLHQAATSTHSELNNSTAHQLINDIQSNWSKMNQLGEQQTAAFQDAQSMQKTYDMSQSAGFSLNDESINNTILDQARSSGDHSILNAVTATNPTSNQRIIRDSFAKNVIETSVLSSLSAYSNISETVGSGTSSVNASFAASSAGLQHSGSAIASGARNQTVSSGYQPLGNTPSYQAVGSTAKGEIEGAGQQVRQGASNINQQDQVVQGTVDSNQQKMNENANKGALSNARDHLASAEAALLRGKNGTEAIDALQNRDYKKPSQNGGGQ